MMANNDDNEFVVFEDADGNEVSNDPRWRAQKTLRDSGVEASDGNSSALREELASKDQEIEALRQQLAAAQMTEQLDDDEDDAEASYADVKGPDLVKLAKERGIALKREDGTKLKAGEVRAALAEQDAKV